MSLQSHSESVLNKERHFEGEEGNRETSNVEVWMGGRGSLGSRVRRGIRDEVSGEGVGDE